MNSEYAVPAQAGPDLQTTPVVGWVPATATADDTRRAWVTAVLEGRYATAAYLAPGLPPVDTCSIVTPPEEDRERFACAGEIHT